MFIVYLSPAGSTRRVAEVIEKKFLTLGAEVYVFDLAKGSGDAAAEISRNLSASRKKGCLCIGSPVYVSHVVPPVMEFVAGLPENSNSFAIPFVTWGGACSGISLYETGAELLNKGFTILGAAKVLAVHSLMWTFEDPFGNRHPDAEDFRMVEELVNSVNQKLHQDTPKGIELANLAYQTEEHHAEMEKVDLQAAKAHMPHRTVDTERCNLCRVCAEVCPTDAVGLAPYPVFGDACIFCFNCMRECPEAAIDADFSEVWQRIKDRAAFFSERPYTQIFY